MKQTNWMTYLMMWLTGPKLQTFKCVNCVNFYCKLCKFLLFFTICHPFCCHLSNYSVTYLIYKGDFLALKSQRVKSVKKHFLTTTRTFAWQGLTCGTMAVGNVHEGIYDIPSL